MRTKNVIAQGGYAVTKVVHGGSKLIDKVWDGFDEKVLPILETLVAVGLPAYTLASFRGEIPEEIIELWNEHPFYVGGYFGGLAAIIRRRNLQRDEP